MGDSKRWTVTYTKHMKQKRKVYQDGFLHLQTSTNKVMLLDECEKLLECRLLKKDETVASGETLMFNGYLVDIGETPEAHSKPESDFNVDRKNRNDSKFGTPSEDTKINRKEHIARKPLSPSQKIIKEFKKRELLKYGSPKITLETTKPSTAEWQVLYTSQVTQKAKKYHDGFLRVRMSGSCRGQVMLSDASRKLLDSRLLKKDDIIRPGESIIFDAYLVDIGEHQENHKPDSGVQADICTNVERVEKMDRLQRSLGTDTHVTEGKLEWQVLYTTQLTQKAKKYHDGFLVPEFCGNRGRQVVLCDSSKKTLEHRFLKKDEVIRPGDSVYFDEHLVDVGDPEGSHQSPVKLNEKGTGDNVVNVESRQIRHGQDRCLKANPSATEGQPPSRPCFGKDAGLNSFFTGLEEKKSNSIIPPLKPLRNANQILSILQDPVAQEYYVTGDSTKASASNYGLCQNIMERESTETTKSPDITSSKVGSASAATCRGGSFHFNKNAKISHQPYSDEETQTNTREADIGIFISNSGSHSCLNNNEGKNAEEFSCKTETCPSFDLGL